ncbi:PilZ domain-containing protein [Amaricoccus sp.]|uniref:PilZ domain-containing protein n=1 Tax=Amaricoccus sp. TaxID=1872485 RepID=UPI002621A822|nr:PilZ domain-containing protein [Amaricoccus sp.]HRO12221.1 PilZ domain-containing protein [Amaricoccus sp.]
MGERRLHPRAHVLRRARIVFRRGYSSLDCVVLDLSPAGARLKVDDWLALPDRFELRIENGPRREAEVRFRAMETTGVRFVDERAA